MKRSLLLMTAAISVSVIPQPATAQTRSQPFGVQNLNAPILTKVYGRVNQVSGQQFTLNSNVGQLTISKAQSINLQPNEPVTVTGTPDTQSGMFNAYSITRSDGTNITFSSNGVSVQRLIDRLN